MWVRGFVLEWVSVKVEDPVDPGAAAGAAPDAPDAHVDLRSVPT
jgi:hypothetical protein